MEILHVFGVDWKLITVQMINFAILLFILTRYVYKPLLALIEKRQKAISESLEEAKRIQDARATIHAEKESTILSAKEEGAAIVAHMRHDGESQARNIVHDAEEKASTILATAKQQAIEEKEYLIKESEKELAKLMVLGAEKILRTKVAAK